MQSQKVNVTTQELKKDRFDSKVLDGQVVELQNGIVVYLNETVQRLDKNQHFHPSVGSHVRLVDGRQFDCFKLEKVGRPAQFVLHCLPV